MGIHFYLLNNNTSSKHFLWAHAKQPIVCARTAEISWRERLSLSPPQQYYHDVSDNTKTATIETLTNNYKDINCCSNVPLKCFYTLIQHFLKVSVTASLSWAAATWAHWACNCSLQGNKQRVCLCWWIRGNMCRRMCRELSEILHNAQLYSTYRRLHQHLWFREFQISPWDAPFFSENYENQQLVLIINCWSHCEA